MLHRGHHWACPSTGRPESPAIGAGPASLRTGALAGEGVARWTFGSWPLEANGERAQSAADLTARLAVRLGWDGAAGHRPQPSIFHCLLVPSPVMGSQIRQPWSLLRPISAVQTPTRCASNAWAAKSRQWLPTSCRAGRAAANGRNRAAAIAWPVARPAPARRAAPGCRIRRPAPGWPAAAH